MVSNLGMVSNLVMVLNLEMVSNLVMVSNLEMLSNLVMVSNLGMVSGLGMVSILGMVSSLGIVNRNFFTNGRPYSIGIYLERENHPFPEERVQLRRLRDNVRGMYEHIYNLPIMGSYCYRPDLEQTGQRGRPRFRINADQLQFLRSEFNSWTEVAADLGVSRQTVYNRRRELGFSLDFEGFSNITNDDLDSIVRDELSAFPRTGETNLIGGLRSRGIYVQRWRVRQSIVRVDPINRANRWGERIVRRPYSVPHPNFLWHMDTNMKLRHWRLCIHGCVDGYSRSIIYLRLNNNNRATTVLNCFQTATRLWGHPSRVRADDGGENIAVGEYMEWYRGANRGSFITGPKVRNTRIERLWRDIGEGVISVFSSLFRHLEVQGIQNPNSELDIFALHFVYVPRIQRSLDRFSERFSYHSLSTEGNRTPHQLWASFLKTIIIVPRSARGNVRQVLRTAAVHRFEYLRNIVTEMTREFAHRTTRN